MTPPTDRDALLGDAPVDPSMGGYTLVAGGASTLEAAQARAVALREDGWRASAIEGTTEAGARIFRVCVGQFASQRHALAALARLRGRVLPADAWMLRL